MGRRKRPHAPGVIFHLVSRTHRGEPWFAPDLRTQIADLIHPIVARTDAQLLAYAVMPNHLHLIVRQGQAGLSAFMQPLLRRVAYRVQKHHGFEGTVVERPYRDRPCLNAGHVREAIIYTHLNPWRAGLCGHDLAYPWTTQPAYLPGADPTPFGIDPEVQRRLLELFGVAREQPRDELCRDYMRWLEWRMDQDRSRAASADAPVDNGSARRPELTAADRAWRLHFAADVEQYPGRREQALPDLRDFMRSRISCTGPAVRLNALRGSWLPHQLARQRSRLIKAAAERGYRTGGIARFFGISPQTVSRLKYAPTRGPI